MTYYPIFIVLILAIVDWVAIEKGWKRVDYVLKPITSITFLWWIWLAVGFGGDMLWFTIGMFFCLTGDVLLMLPAENFIYGIFAFLAGQIFLIIALNDAPPYINLWGAILIVLLGGIVWLIYPKLASGLSTKGKDSLQIPVLVYTIIITLMVYSALMTWTRAGWLTSSALLVSIGAVLFYASDTLTGWRRFVNPFNHSHLLERSAYHLGLIGIILGAMLHVI